MIWPIKPVIDNSVRGLCVQPYQGHKKGCPNFGDKPRCPPQALLLHEVLDLSKPVYLIANRYAFGEHVERMRGLHPEWSQRQLECCLYWQGTARKQLKEELERFKDTREWIADARSLTILTTPEACGVDVTATMKSVGIDLEWPPVNYAYQVALAGKPIKPEGQGVLL